MTEKPVPINSHHCHFCRSYDVAEITQEDIAFFICIKHAIGLQMVLNTGIQVMIDGNPIFKNLQFKVTQK